MPQMDLETLVCGGSGRVACETVIAGEPPNTAAAVMAEDADFPPESFTIPIGDEIEWVDLNAVYERDDSTKGNTNPKSQHANVTATTDHRISNSKRFSGNLKPKAPIIALPNKLQHSGYLGRSSRRPASGRIFIKKDRSAGVAEREPGSPKVSCFGKVRSERERERERQRGTIRQRDGGRGFWMTFFCCAGGDRGSSAEFLAEQHSAPSWSKPSSLQTQMPAPAPGLEGMKRFASGRRPASWGGDEDGHVEWSGLLDEDGFRIRRSIGSIEDANREADT
ncbi:putative calcium/calmodulin-dependent protein kinase [Dioscorea sansibarensis]